MQALDWILLLGIGALVVAAFVWMRHRKKKGLGCCGGAGCQGGCAGCTACQQKNNN